MESSKSFERFSVEFSHLSHYLPGSYLNLFSHQKLSTREPETPCGEATPNLWLTAAGGDEESKVDGGGAIPKLTTQTKFNSSPLKIGLPNRKVVFQPPFLRGYAKLPGSNPCSTSILQKLFCFLKGIPLAFGKANSHPPWKKHTTR